MHVRGFTRNPNSGVPPERRGTFAGVIDKIPYLKELGITMVELLPVQQFDPQEGNYWGYMPLNFFAPHAGYASDAQGRPRRVPGDGPRPARGRHPGQSSTSSTTTRPRPARTGRPTAIAGSTTSPST
jgi:Type II secretory pathway, pullulanase PulA and related glycosidases